MPRRPEPWKPPEDNRRGPWPEVVLAPFQSLGGVRFHGKVTVDATWLGLSDMEKFHLWVDTAVRCRLAPRSGATLATLYVQYI